MSRWNDAESWRLYCAIIVLHTVLAGYVVALGRTATVQVHRSPVRTKKRYKHYAETTAVRE